MDAFFTLFSRWVTNRGRLGRFSAAHNSTDSSSADAIAAVGVSPFPCETESDFAAGRVAWKTGIPGTANPVTSETRVTPAELPAMRADARVS